MWSVTRLCPQLLAAAMVLAPISAVAQLPTYVTIDVESLREVTFDALVTCPVAFGTHIEGGEGCPTGRAPVTGECGLGNSCPEPLSVFDAIAAADHYWGQNYVLPIVLDMGVPTDSVFVFNAVDHDPLPEESIEWTVWGSDNPATAGFPAGWSVGTLRAVFQRGWVESGSCPGDDADDYTGLYEFDRAYAYVAVYSNYSITIYSDRAHTSWPAAGDDSTDPGWQSSEAELDAVARPVGPKPAVDAGPDRNVCSGATLRFDANASPGLIYRYGWDTDGDAVVDATGPSVVVAYPLPGAYTVSVGVIGECGLGSDSVSVIVRDCPLAVVFDRAAANRVMVDGEHAIAITWETASELDTVLFVVERAARPEGPFSAFAEPVPAMGPGFGYRLIDRDAAVEPQPWYRVVEYGAGGRGDLSAAFAPAAPAAASGARSRRR